MPEKNPYDPRRQPVWYRTWERTKPKNEEPATYETPVYSPEQTELFKKFTETLNQPKPSPFQYEPTPKPEQFQYQPTAMPWDYSEAAAKNYFQTSVAPEYELAGKRLGAKVNAAYAGPGYWGSSRAMAQERGAADIEGARTKAFGETMWQNEQQKRQAEQQWQQTSSNQQLAQFQTNQQAEQSWQTTQSNQQLFAEQMNQQREEARLKALGTALEQRPTEKQTYWPQQEQQGQQGQSQKGQWQDPNNWYDPTVRSADAFNRKTSGIIAANKAAGY